MACNAGKTGRGVAIVPAKGNSERFPGKMLAPLGGRPLICHTLDTLQRVPDIDVVVISDSNDILRIAHNHPLSIRCVRLPDEVTNGRAKVLDSVLWTLDSGFLPRSEWIGLFLPTCPLRLPSDVLEAVSLLHGTSGADGVISTTDYEFPPTLGLVVDPDGFIQCSDPRLPWLTGNTRSQDHTGIVRPNGAVYVKWTQKFLEHRNFYRGHILQYHMPRTRSVDIDYVEDMLTAERMFQRQSGAIEFDI